MHKSMMHKDVIAQEEAQGADTGGPYCELCSVQFTSAQAWKRHMVTSVKHTQATHFHNGCRVCGESFKSPEELRVHHRKEHARKRPKNYGKKPPIMTWPSKCEHCEEEIPNAREYWTHFRRAHPDRQYPIQKSYICEICGKSFRGNAFLVYHKRTHFEERAYKCAQCPKAFFNRTNLQMHEKTHSDRRPYPCTVCFKAFKCKGALDRHFRVSLERLEYNDFKRNDAQIALEDSVIKAPCPAAFFSRSNLQMLHEKTHSDRRPHPCTACFKAFKCKGALDRHFRMHEKTHSDRRPYPCTVCFKAFKFSNSNAEIALEDSVIKAPCPAAFFSRSNLQMHEKTRLIGADCAKDREICCASHTGVKPYTCEFCGKSFGQSNSRKLHVRTVHLRQPAPYVSRARQERRRT
ncbi:hypothetical protein JYU34_015977 [Plutella xylostella]|uniref:C2H2-type domain-containing protein n=1 Tax=Plutella xylostella TaxID=51655 RepID=A0ABQ7Q562_PLUXY|nr:hypothetical protein JYU34_015977 [Plutella xylostella]